MSNGGVSPVCVHWPPALARIKREGKPEKMQQCPKKLRCIRVPHMEYMITGRARRNVTLLCVVPDQGHTHTNTHSHISHMSTHCSSDRFSLSLHARALEGSRARAHRLCESYRIWRLAASLLFEWSEAPADSTRTHNRKTHTHTAREDIVPEWCVWMSWRGMHRQKL